MPACGGSGDGLDAHAKPGELYGGGLLSSASGYGCGVSGWECMGTSMGDDGGRQKDKGAVDSHGHGHEFGRRGREMVRRLKRTLVGGGGGGGEKSGGGHDGQNGGHGCGNGELGEGYPADLESLAVVEKEKTGRAGRRFSFF